MTKEADITVNSETYRDSLAPNMNHGMLRGQISGIIRTGLSVEVCGNTFTDEGGFLEWDTREQIKVMPIKEVTDRLTKISEQWSLASEGLRDAINYEELRARAAQLGVKCSIELQDGSSTEYHLFYNTKVV